MWKIEKLISKGKYVYAYVPSHPNATANGYVLEHRIVMENVLNRLLTPNEVVHHINENTRDNRAINLKVLSNKEHAKLHGLLQGKMYVELKCPECNRIFILPKNQTYLVTKKCKYNCCSNKCRGKFSRKIQLHGITHKVEQAISENIVREYKQYSSTTPSKQ